MRQAAAWIISVLLVLAGSGGRNMVQAAPPLTAPRVTEPAPLLYSSAPPQYDAGLDSLINSYVQGQAGNWNIFVKKLDTGQWATYRSDQPQTTASLYKLFVLDEVFREWDAGTLDLDEQWRITSREAAEDQAIDNLKFTIGGTYAISYLLNRMIAVSDNTAAAALVDRVGLDRVNRTIQNLGLKNTYLDFSADNLTTAEDIATLLERIALGQAVSQAASRRMLDLLLAQELNDLIPAGVYNFVPVAHKTGTLDGLRHDAAIVYGPSGPYIFIAMSSGLPDATVAYTVIPHLSAAIYKYFNDQPPQPLRYFPTTTQFIASPFLQVWNTYRGAETLGNPLGPEQAVGGYRVQWFERGRLGLPAGDPTADRVEMGNLGLEALDGRTFDPQPDPHDPAKLWFQATGQVLDGAFLDYWQTYGGVRLFGNPLSPVLSEAVPGAGSLPVQYFERARFELHGAKVQLSDLGRQLYNDANQ